MEQATIYRQSLFAHRDELIDDIVQRFLSYLWDKGAVPYVQIPVNAVQVSRGVLPPQKGTDIILNLGLEATNGFQYYTGDNDRLGIMFTTRFNQVATTLHFLVNDVTAFYDRADGEVSFTPNSFPCAWLQTKDVILPAEKYAEVSMLVTVSRFGDKAGMVCVPVEDYRAGNIPRMVNTNGGVVTLPVNQKPNEDRAIDITFPVTGTTGQAPVKDPTTTTCEAEEAPSFAEVRESAKVIDFAAARARRGL